MLRAVLLLAAVLSPACLTKPPPPGATGATPDASIPVGSCDASACGAAGGSCMAGTCVIASKASAITCPAGMPCRVACSGKDACKPGVSCGDATSCVVQCQGDSACEQGVDCAGAGTCSVDCIGPNACKGPSERPGVTCGDAKCEVTCSGDHACEHGIDATSTCQAHCCNGACSGGVSVCVLDATCS